MGYVTLPVACRAPDRPGALRCAGAVAARAEYGGIHAKWLGGAEGCFGKLKIEPNQRILTAAHPRPRAARGLLAKHRVHQIGEVEASGAKSTVEATHATAQRIAATVVEVTLLGILQHLVRLSDTLEPLSRIRLLCHVGMQLHRKLAVRLLDLLRCRIARDAQDLVVVRAHASCSHPSERKRPT